MNVYTKAQSFENKNFKLVGTAFYSTTVESGHYEEGKQLLIKMADKCLKEHNCNAAVCLDLQYQDIVKWGKSFNDTAYPYDQYGLMTISFSYGIATDKVKSE